MMLAAPSSSTQYKHFQPFHSSPLACDARRVTFGFAMNPANNANYNTSTSAQQSRTSQRQNVKSAPKLSTERLLTQRRGAFLRKVKEGREDRRWEHRGEDVRIDLLLSMRSRKRRQN